MGQGESQGRKGIRGTLASDHLDMIRGLAAIAVMHSHIILILMPGISNVRGLNRLAYYLSNYGNAAVMIFFVLSGYLVGGGVVRSVANQRWSWREYLLARGVRLYLVLIPALLLTAILDRVSQSLCEGLVPGGNANAFITIEKIIAHGGIATFAGNAAFLQTFIVEIYGSNIPLWSLANEAWYYLMFPLMWLSCRSSSPKIIRLMYAIMLVGLLVFVGWKIAGLFPAWLFGVAIALIPPVNALKSKSRLALSGLPLMVVLALIGLRKIEFQSYFESYGVALTFSLFLLAILQQTHTVAIGWYSWIASKLAGCSYTLYLIHMPIAMLCRSLWTFENPWPTDLHHWSLYVLVCVGCVLIAYLLSLITEVHTDHVRKWLARRLFNPGTPAK